MGNRERLFALAQEFKESVSRSGLDIYWALGSVAEHGSDEAVAEVVRAIERVVQAWRV
jgi:hypothetical protein